MTLLHTPANSFLKWRKRFSEKYNINNNKNKT